MSLCAEMSRRVYCCRSTFDQTSVQDTTLISRMHTSVSTNVPYGRFEEAVDELQLSSLHCLRHLTPRSRAWTTSSRSRNTRRRDCRLVSDCPSQSALVYSGLCSDRTNALLALSAPCYIRRQHAHTVLRYFLGFVSPDFWVFFRRG